MPEVSQAAVLPGADLAPSRLGRVLTLDVPVVVLLGERTLPAAEVLALVPGQIIELPKSADAELSLLVNNKPVGAGHAVKVGENFGIRVTRIGDAAARAEAIAGGVDRAAA